MNTSWIISAALAVAAVAGVARAGGISSTLTATYYKVADHSDPDFNVGSTPKVAAGSVLGPHGAPVASTPFGVHDIASPSNEIEWWSPTLDAKVVQTGTGTITLPYASNMFAPNSTGSSDAAFFETAKFGGNFTLGGAGGTVTFTLGSDDDTFLYVDGSLVGQNPGVHGVTTVVFTTPTLAAGLHTITLFYADRQDISAYLSLNSSASITPSGVPEPAAWTLMLVGFGVLGASLRRRHAALAA